MVTSQHGLDLVGSELHSALRNSSPKGVKKARPSSSWL